MMYDIVAEQMVDFIIYKTKCYKSYLHLSCCVRSYANIYLFVNLIRMTSIVGRVSFGNLKTSNRVATFVFSISPCFAHTPAISEIISQRACSYGNEGPRPSHNAQARINT